MYASREVPKSESLVATQVAGRRFEKLLSSSRGIVRFVEFALQIGEVCDANAATDGADMEVNIVVLRLIQRPKQEAAEFRSRRTAKLTPSPDFADRMCSLIAAA